MKYIINQYGIAIKKDCVSCNCGRRINNSIYCSIQNNARKEHCPYWTAKEIERGDRTKGSLLNAGKGGGKIKTASYFRWLNEHRFEVYKKTDETFKAFSERVHKLYEKRTGLPVYYDF